MCWRGSDGTQDIDEDIIRLLVDKKDEIVRRIKDKHTGFVVKDRYHMLRKYENVFVGNSVQWRLHVHSIGPIGSEAVEWLLRSGLVRSRKKAVALGNALMHAGVFRHVLNEHEFEDAKLFYRFVEA